MNLALYFICFYFGAVIGSFLNVVILRLPESKTLSGRSSCVSCGHSLSGLELVPLLSFLFLFGKCRHCKSKISTRYFIIETLTGLLFAAVFYYIQPATALDYLLFAKDLLAVCLFLVIFVIDLEHFLILDAVVYPSLASIIILNFFISLATHSMFLWNGVFFSGLIGSVAAGGFFFCIWFVSKGRWMGFGDVKLALLLGVIFGWPLVLVSIFAGIFLGGVISVFLLLSGTKNMKSALPFGTFLTCGSLIAMFYGRVILEWYLKLIGLA